MNDTSEEFQVLFHQKRSKRGRIKGSDLRLTLILKDQESNGDLTP